jgi:hypothetical protein
MATPVDESTVGETPLVELDLPLARTVYAKDVSVVGFEPADPLHAIDGLKYLRTGDLTADDPVVLLFADRGDKYADIPLWEDYL